jgi:hypothetical protein
MGESLNHASLDRRRLPVVVWPRSELEKLSLHLNGGSGPYVFVAT